MKKDEFSPFRSMARSARNRPVDSSITAEYLKSVWDNQEGICPLSGEKISLDRDKGGVKGQNPYKASLDRIDPNLGYVEGNVRFIAYIANLAKLDWTDEVVIDFCKAVIDNNL